MIAMMTGLIAFGLLSSAVASDRAELNAQVGILIAKFNSPTQSVLVYADCSGLYGGVALKGGDLYPDSKDNESYYWKPVSVYDILFEPKITATPAAQSFAHAIDFNSMQKPLTERIRRRFICGWRETAGSVG